MTASEYSTYCLYRYEVIEKGERSDPGSHDRLRSTVPELSRNKTSLRDF